MKHNDLIEQFGKMNDETEDANFKKVIKRLVNLLKEIECKDIPDDMKMKIQTSISPFLENIHTKKDFKLSLKKLRKSLIGDFGFVPSNYYLTLGVSIGLALGTALGISLGVPFDRGIVFGQMTGSGIGLIGGLLIGMFLDKKKESENRILKYL
jgi:hypothetical protein